MKRVFFVVTIILVCVLSLSVGVYALNQENVWDKIFKKDLDNISFDELKEAKDEHLKLELSPQEADEYGKKLKEVISEKVDKSKIVEREESNIDTLIEQIENDIYFFEESINNDPTINDDVRSLKKQQVNILKSLLISVKAKEKNYEYYFGKYEKQRLEYIDKYKSLRDKQ